jgi:hypothetical protein
VADREYIKLTPLRQRGGLAIVSSHRSNLWLGKDHLLGVETEGYTESYKRFYFQDIQSITLRKTGRGWVLAIVTGLLTGFFAFVAAAVDPAEAKWVFGIIAGVCAIPFLLNFLYGPTCACELRTAVQTEEIPSLGRIRRARKVIARLRPLIADAQGRITADEILLRFQELITLPATAGPEPPIIGTTNVPPSMTD